MTLQPATADAIACDVSRRFVRVLQVRSNGLVEFEFSIGWPELAVELMLPRPAFDAFCRANNVQRLDDGTATPVSTPV
ncbi:MAG: phenol hydroxylase subunit [Burkholderiaceae bacterium]|nr:phenol hydroxylase subunit [Burkholderiaceae bacterium]